MAKRRKKRVSDRDFQDEARESEVRAEETLAEAEAQDAAPSESFEAVKADAEEALLSAPEESEVEEAEESETEEAEPEETPAPEDDPYAAYRHRWDASLTEGKKGGHKGFSFSAFCIAMVSLVLAIGLCYGSLLVWRSLKEGGKPPAAVTEPGPVVPEAGDVTLAPAAPLTPADALSVQEVIARNKPSIVCIKVVKTDASTGVATGFIVSEKGYIVTNKHVIDTPATLTVLTADGGSHAASLVGSDDLSDIAVLKISAEGLVPIVLGDSSLIQQGDFVVAIGTPASAEFACSATFGIISGANRLVQMKDSAGNVTKTYTVMQTDASINPGNSGGPLLNVYGQVIGINSLKLSTDSYEGIGFALPINGVISIANQIISKGRVSDRPQDDYVRGATVIGATLKTYSQADADAAQLVPGAYVYTVEKGGAAEAAGLAMGDIITKFDGREIKTVTDVTEALLQKQAGDVVAIEVYRARQTLTLSVTLAAFDGAN